MTCSLRKTFCSGLDIQTEHRQNLHELILGAQGVSLNTALQTHVAARSSRNAASSPSQGEEGEPDVSWGECTAA
jgi:hypothetical protein